MKWCVTFPEETVLVVRPSLAAICLDNKPAGKLLGALLYRYSIRKEHQTEAENINDVKVAQGKSPDQDTTFRIYRTQAHLVEDMCGEITEKTLHDVAIPTLQLLGYLDVEELPGRNCYDLHLEPITRALALYNPNSKEQPALAAFFPGQLQLEKFLIQLEDFPFMSNELEDFLFDKNFFLLLLEKVLIANRNTSHCKRGRKPRTEAASSGNSEKPQIRNKIGSKNRKKEVRNGAAVADTTSRAPEKENTHANRTGDMDNRDRYHRPVSGDPPDARGHQDRTAPTQPKREGTRSQPGKRDAAPNLITLSEQEQAFYDLYCSMPWIKVAPPITDKTKEQCARLAPHLTTQEQLFSLRNFMAKKDFFKGKGFGLAMLAYALNDWAMEQVDVQGARKQAPPPESDAVKQEKLARAQAALASLQAAQPVGMGV